MAPTRTFLAIELDDTTRAFIREREHGLAQAMPQVRFVAEATWHLTLAFLGDLTTEQLAAARLAAHTAAATTAPFTLHATRIDTFGADDAPSVIWIGVGGMTRELFALQQQVAAALHAHSIPFDDKHFVPHITLARLHHPLTSQETQALRVGKALAGQGPPLPVTAISVMRSDLSPSGAHYTALDRAMLATPR